MGSYCYAFHWESGAIREIFSQVRGKSVDETVRNQILGGLWEFAYAGTRAGQRLLDFLNDSDSQSLVKSILEKAPTNHPLFEMLTAIRDLQSLATRSGVTLHEAIPQWLERPEVSSDKKATLLRLYLNGSNFNGLWSHIPQTQRSEVQSGISRFSNIDIFKGLLSENQAPAQSRSWLRRSVPTTTDESILNQAKLESFEFVRIAVPGDGVTVRLGEQGNALRDVMFTKPYEIGTTPLTQLQYALLMGENPSHFKDGDGSIEVAISGKKIRVQPNRPVEQVSWNDEVRLINRLNELDPNFTYRRATEAEWEYAIRGVARARSLQLNFGCKAHFFGI